MLEKREKKTDAFSDIISKLSLRVCVFIYMRSTTNCANNRMYAFCLSKNILFSLPYVAYTQKRYIRL